MSRKHSDKHSWAEPYKIKMVELLRMTTLEERQQAIQEAVIQHFPDPQQGRLY